MTSNEIINRYNKEKYWKLLAAVGIDALGLTSYLLPAIGELSDVVIAPISALLLFAVFKSKNVAIFGFAEEALPFTDVIPTGTLFWIKKYVINGNATFEQYVQTIQSQQQILKKYAL